MPRPPAQKNVLLWLCRNVTLQTDRTTSPSYVGAELPETEEWGPYLASIRPLTVTRNRTANHTWMPTLMWSVDGSTFSSPVPLVSALSANGQLIHPAYSNADNFAAPHIRFALGTANSTGADLESAVVSVGLIFTFQT